jgi:CBS domain-containing protein
MLVVAEDGKLKGWLRIDMVLDYLHQGRAKLEGPVRDLMILPAEKTTPEETIGSVMLKFARTPDREFVVLDDGQKIVGTLALLDLILAARNNAAAPVSDKHQ